MLDADIRIQSRAAGAALPPAPVQDALPENGEVVPEENEPVSRSIARNPALDRTVRDRAREGNAAAALSAIARSRASTAYAALLKGELAQILFQAGRDEEAFRVASEAARNAGGTGFPAFVAGLAAWGMDRPELALPYFEAAARADATSPAA